MPLAINGFHKGAFIINKCLYYGRDKICLESLRVTLQSTLFVFCFFSTHIISLFSPLIFMNAICGYEEKLGIFRKAHELCQIKCVIYFYSSRLRQLKRKLRNIFSALNLFVRSYFNGVICFKLMHQQPLVSGQLNLKYLDMCLQLKIIIKSCCMNYM